MHLHCQCSIATANSEDISVLTLSHEILSSKYIMIDYRVYFRVSGFH